MICTAIDLATCITPDGPLEPLDSEIQLRRLYFTAGSESQEVSYHAVVRRDTDEAIAVVPDGRPLHLHDDVMEAVLTAAAELDLGPMHRGVHLDRAGARMRAIITFPELTEPVLGTDRVCPFLMVENSYDRGGRIIIYTGAMRCATKALAVGGGGVFAQTSLHLGFGEVSSGQMELEVGRAIYAFPAIIRAFRIWAGRSLDVEGLTCILEGLPPAMRSRLWRRIGDQDDCTVFDAYSAVICHATRSMPSVQAAFRLLVHVNAGFQRVFRSH